MSVWCGKDDVACFASRSNYFVLMLPDALLGNRLHTKNRNGIPHKQSICLSPDPRLPGISLHVTHSNKGNETEVKSDSATQRMRF
jgi:hypothetical protein